MTAYESMTPMKLPRVGEAPTRWHFTRELVRRMDEAGLFPPDQRLELIEGELIVMAPMGEPHAKAIEHLNISLVRGLPPGFSIRCQLPIAAEIDSQPFPDFSVTRDGGAEADDGMPARPELIVEIATSSLRFDLGRKARLYARIGVPEYWVVDVKKKQLIVHRSPTGSRYRSVKQVTDLSNVTSSAVPALKLDLRHIFLKR